MPLKQVNKFIPLSTRLDAIVSSHNSLFEYLVISIFDLPGKVGFPGGVLNEWGRGGGGGEWQITVKMKSHIRNTLEVWR